MSVSRYPNQQLCQQPGTYRRRIQTLTIYTPHRHRTKSTNKNKVITKDVITDNSLQLSLHKRNHQIVQPIWEMWHHATWLLCNPLVCNAIRVHLISSVASRKSYIFPFPLSLFSFLGVSLKY